MPLLNIKTISLRNFRSFGDYDTTLGLDNLGPVLITGQVDGNENKSNGAGKTSIIDAIIWALFGRLPSKDRPADWVINQEVGKDCSVVLTTLDDYVITRTRNVAGHDDLLIHTPNGEDISDSTSQNAQKHLNRLFNLDYEIFTSSIFFAQFGRPFLELTDLKRKRALERMLSLAKFDYYAEVAKEKKTTLEQEQSKYTLEVQQLENSLTHTSLQIEQNTDHHKTHETKRQERLAQLQAELNKVDEQVREQEQTLHDQLQQLKIQLPQIQTYDIAALEAQWKQHLEMKTLLAEANKKLRAFEAEIIKAETEIESLEQTMSDPQELQDVLIAVQERIANLPDLEDTKRRWKEHAALLTKIEELDSEITETSQQQIRVQSEIDLLKEAQGKLSKMTGAICPECQQKVPAQHVDRINKSLENKIFDAQKKLDFELQTQRNTLETEKTNLEKQAEEMNLATRVEDLQKLQEAYTREESTLLKERKDQEKLEKRLSLLRTAFNKDHTAFQERSKQFAEKEKQILASTPAITINEAIAAKAQYDAKLGEITAVENNLSSLNEQRKQIKEGIRNQIKTVKEEINPYDQLLSQLQAGLNETRQKRDNINKQITQYNVLIDHAEYIRSAYSDRKKIRAYLLTKLIPYFNERITYYLNSIGCEYRIEFNTFLQTKSDKWPYELWSGGERKRIDLAIMFAIYDLYVTIYEQQCNLLVFDEIDGRLDSSGITAFINLIYQEFVNSQSTSRPRTILIISHKDEMKDAFPTQILVRKTNGFSKIEEIR